MFRAFSNALRLGLLSLTLPLAARAQATVSADSPLPRLLTERKVLTNRYAEAHAQRHSLFGNKPSKKDLQEVVDALQGIVDKDQQIVDALNRTTVAAQTAAQHYGTAAAQLQNTSRDDRNLTAQRLHEAQNDLDNAHQREKKQLARVQELEADLTDAQSGQLIRDALVAGLGLLSVGLLVALRRRR
jgi:MYXO-CTERM domain-containing protein